LRQRTALREHERRQDEQRREDLDELGHDTTSDVTPSSVRVRRELSSG
jgi:hypothetical protein